MCLSLNMHTDLHTHASACLYEYIQHCTTVSYHIQMHRFIRKLSIFATSHIHNIYIYTYPQVLQAFLTSCTWLCLFQQTCYSSDVAALHKRSFAEVRAGNAGEDWETGPPEGCFAYQGSKGGHVILKEFRWLKGWNVGKKQVCRSCFLSFSNNRSMCFIIYIPYICWRFTHLTFGEFFIWLSFVCCCPFTRIWGFFGKRPGFLGCKKWRSRWILPHLGEFGICYLMQEINVMYLYICIYMFQLFF